MAVPTRPYQPDWPGHKLRFNQNYSTGILQKRYTWQDIGTAGGANLTVNMDWVGWPGGTMIVGGYLYLLQTFGGGTINAFTFSVGTTGTPTLIVNAANLFTGQALGIKVGATLTPGTGFIGGAATPNALGTIRVVPTAVAGNLNTLTSGKVIVCLIVQATRLPIT